MVIICGNNVSKNLQQGDTRKKLIPDENEIKVFPLTRRHRNSRDKAGLRSGSLVKDAAETFSAACTNIGDSLGYFRCSHKTIVRTGHYVEKCSIKNLKIRQSYATSELDGDSTEVLTEL